MQFYSLSAEENFVINGLQEGKTFSQLCEGLCEWLPPEEAGLRAAFFLKKFIMDELISELKFDS